MWVSLRLPAPAMVILIVYICALALDNAVNLLQWFKMADCVPVVYGMYHGLQAEKVCKVL